MFHNANQEREYRDRTNRIVTGPSMSKTFRCVECKQFRNYVGRRAVIPRYSKAGYRCAQCVRERGAA